jgi:hypothetical protein
VWQVGHYNHADTALLNSYIDEYIAKYVIFFLELHEHKEEVRCIGSLPFRKEAGVTCLVLHHVLHHNGFDLGFYVRGELYLI